MDCLNLRFCFDDGGEPCDQNGNCGLVDLIQDNVLRVEYDSTHLADMQGVNRFQ